MDNKQKTSSTAKIIGIVIMFLLLGLLKQGCNSMCESKPEQQPTIQTQSSINNNSWINTEYYYQALNEKNVTRAIVDDSLPAQYNWVNSAKDVITAWEDWGYYVAEFTNKGTWAGAPQDIKERAARMLAESHYLQWLSDKYNVNVDKQKRAMNKGEQNYLHGK